MAPTIDRWTLRRPARARSVNAGDGCAQVARLLGVRQARPRPDGVNAPLTGGADDRFGRVGGNPGEAGNRRREPSLRQRDRHPPSGPLARSRPGWVDAARMRGGGRGGPVGARTPRRRRAPAPAGPFAPWLSERASDARRGRKVSAYGKWGQERRSASAPGGTRASAHLTSAGGARLSRPRRPSRRSW